MKKRLFPLLLLALLLIGLSLSSCDAAFLSSGTPRPAVSSGDGTLRVHFIDVGQADAALLLSDGQAMLIDGGNVADSDRIVAYLKDQGVKTLDYLVCTHAHEDHVGGLSGALNAASIGTAYAPVTEYDSKAFHNFAKYVAAQKKTIEVPKPGTQFSLGSAAVEILGPIKAYKDENNTSIVLRVTHGENTLLFTGDMERTAEADLLDAGINLQADLLKVGHHGSETSTSYPFLRAVAPTYGVISVGTENSYGHPNEDLLSRLRDAEVTLYRTDLQGHIVATSDGKTLDFATQKTAHTPVNPTETDGKGQNASPAYYIGNTRSHKFHQPNCSALPAEQNQIVFDTKEKALSEDYTPCSNCL